MDCSLGRGSAPKRWHPDSGFVWMMVFTQKVLGQSSPVHKQKSKARHAVHRTVLGEHLPQLRRGTGATLGDQRRLTEHLG